MIDPGWRLGIDSLPGRIRLALATACPHAWRCFGIWNGARLAARRGRRCQCVPIHPSPGNPNAFEKYGRPSGKNAMPNCAQNQTAHKPINAREITVNKRKAPPRSLQQIAGTVPVLNVRGQDAHAEQETERIDEDVAPAAPMTYLPASTP